MTKTKDLFLNMAVNPNMSLEDLVSVGLTSENTMLLDRAQYASNEKVQDMFRDAEGNFDEQTFNTFYDIAQQSYNILATDAVNTNLLDMTAYDADNIFVDPSKRRVKNEPIAIKLPNPDRLNVGVTRIGKIGERTQSRDEIAQTQQVLLNPVAVANGEKPIYGSSPNESWFEDFWDTRVMAAWDEDGTHIDPITGKEVKHSKGDLKLNENGTYYYESLDGRSVYGKQVLNKFNTLTTDGSAWNKYDFFDSDDIEQKSIGGSVLKNLALVGSMFIPYVGWGIAAASVAHQSAGLFATLGKMLAGSDSPTLDAIEGWVKSTDRRNLKTEYAQQNMWCWENFIDLIGDTTAQLREQRAIFKFAPGLIKGDFKALSDTAMDKFEKDLAKKYMAEASQLSFKDLVKLAKQQNPVHWKEQLALLQAGASDIFTAKAKKAARDYVSNYYKLGEPIAKAYMTAITVQDTFGEAIQSGASDSEATLLTLGYAAAEAALLSTDLGKWIMPELRQERQRAKLIAKKLLELPQETREVSKQLSRLGNEAKKDWAKRLFNIGKDIARAEYSTMSKTVGSVIASGLGEGVEEVSEEFLADFSKSCFNLVQKLQGDETRMLAWNNVGDRYAMSFVGGIMGGSINAAASDYKANKDLLNMNSQQAMQQIVYMARNNELDDFWKVINKTELAPTNLSTKLNSDGVGYQPGTKEDNQDLEAKRALKKQISMVESILNAENAKLDDSGLLSALIKADPSLKDLDPVKEYRMRALSNSATAGRFLNEWNTITSDIIKNRMEQNKIIGKYGDASSEKYSEEDAQTLKQLGSALKELQARKEQMLDGGRTREYVRDALFEMSYAVKEVFDDWCTEVRYAEAKTGKKYADISEDEKKKLKEQYEQLKSSNEYAEKVHELADIYETLAASASQGITNSYNYYTQILTDSQKNITALDKLAKKRLGLLQNILEDPEGVNILQQVLDNNFQDDIVIFNDQNKLVTDLQNLEIDTNNKINAIINGRTEDQLTIEDWGAINIEKNKARDVSKKIILDSVFDKINKTYDDYIKLGFIHPETKQMLSNMLKQLSAYADASLGLVWDVDDAADLYEQRMLELSKKAEELEKLSNTPIIENLRQFQLSTATDKSAVDLVEYLIRREQQEQGDISAFQLDNVTIQQFEDARKLLTMYRSAIVGARTDAVDIDNIVGFNTTLNEISGEKDTVKLAEIDAQTADLILQDIDTVLKRIDYSETLHKLNTGNKYNVQAKTALNKQYIIHNKIRRIVSILQDDDEWKDKNGESEFQELLDAIERASTLNSNSGFNSNFESRNFALSPQDKAKIEKESIEIQTALHKFLSKHIDGSDESIAKLEKLLTYDNFKGLIRENDGFLDQNSEDIDDSAFIWWLASTAALNPHQFFNSYRQIIGTEAEGERPIAPIPTQELGVFALTASVVNGDMFRHFGRAIRNSLNNFWENASESDRERVRNEYGANILYEDSNKIFFKSNDFLPNFDNILFIEGIAGSGKSTGVLKAWSKLLAKTNPEFVGEKILFAHTSKEKAETLAKSTFFTNFEAHDHDSLLSYISPDYKPHTGEDVPTYILGKDAILVDGILRSNQQLQVYDPNDVPKVIVIDEWTHYNQLEQELLQRFAQTYGVSILSMGDFDQLTPVARLKRDEKDDKPLDLTPSRNMTARVAKLGVSMRTDNEIKNGNMYRMLAWKQHPTAEVELHYYEDDTGIYGDKRYGISGDYGSDLEKIKLDVKKMISTLKPNEKIGYIYSDVNSELYKYLTTTDGVKEHIQVYKEKDAHGREAQYYVIENNRASGQDALEYFQSVYTGITRSEQGSILITNTGSMKKNLGDKHNKTGISFKTVQDTEMLPNTFTDEGTREFSRKRKATLDSIFGNEDIIPFDIKARTIEEVQLTPQNSNQPTVTPPTPTPQPQVVPPTPPSPAPTPVPTPTPTPTPAPVINTTTQIEAHPVINIASNQIASLCVGVKGTLEQAANLGFVKKGDVIASIRKSDGTLVELLSPDDLHITKVNSNIGDTVGASTELFDVSPNNPSTPPTSAWIGPLPKGQKVYSESGQLIGIIEDEGNSNYDGKEYYVLYDASSGYSAKESKESVHKARFFAKPDTQPLYESQFITFNGETFRLVPELYGNQNKPVWAYRISDKNISSVLAESQLQQFIDEGKLIVKVEPKSDEPVIVPEILEETEGVKEYEEVINQEMEDPQPEVIESSGPDINFRLLGFTFNNQYLADRFDNNSNIVVDPEDALRIDNGYGLHAIDPVSFNSKQNIRKAIGDIRRQLEFSDNATIIRNVQKYLGLSNLSMRWAFISKGSVSNSGKFGRFNLPDNAELEYMNKEDTDVPSKTLSAIFYDQSGVPILEIPMITFQSPHSIFRELKDKNIAPDIVNAWVFGPHAPGQTYKLLKDILSIIESKYKNNPGYQRLGDAIKLWLFTSNGVKVLPKDWNLHDSNTNIGNIYVLQRYSDDIKPHDFSAEWVNLAEFNREDRFVSSIMMNNSNKHTTSSGKLINIFRPYTPYVFISDDPKINTDAAAARRYLEQQEDPTLETTVKVVPVIPPETSVSNYIQAMYRVIKRKSTYEPYGNKYTPYRIWDAILQSEHAQEIMSQLSQEDRDFVINTIQSLRDAKARVTPDESKLKYKSDVAKEQNKILDAFVGDGKDQVQIFSKLRGVLVQTCFYDQFGTDEVGNSHILSLIEEACEGKVTGVLCKPQFAKNQSGVAVGGFAYQVNVPSQNKFMFPGQGSFRIFGKIDPPTYDLSVMLDSIIPTWTSNMKRGVEWIDPDTGEKQKRDNVWKFLSDDASMYYLEPDTRQSLNLASTIQYSNNLIAKLGIKEYNITTTDLAGVSTEAKAREVAREKIEKKYLEQPGNFILPLSDGSRKYGSIITNGTKEFENYKFDGYEVNQGKTILRFVDLNTNQEQKLEISLDLATDSFLITPISNPSTNKSLDVKTLKTEVANSLANSVLAKNDAYKDLLQNLIDCFDADNNSVDEQTIETLIQNSGLKGLSERSLRKTLQLDRLSNEQQQDVCINPIKISFK